MSGECKAVIICESMHCTPNFKKWVHFSKKGEKKQELYEGILIKESIEDDSIIDCLNVYKIELWNTGGKPKYWTALFFTSDKTDFPEQISKVMLSNPDKNENWFVDFKAGNEKYIVFKNRIIPQ